MNAPHTSAWRSTVPVAGLKGIRVLDFTWAGAGPMATEILCLLGANVVKVESASRPDLLRIVNVAYGWGKPDIESSSCFNDINAGKWSIALDLKRPEARALARRLANCADVVADNMRPGKMEALGLGYAELSVLNPRVVYCSLSATGRIDPVEGKPAPDIPGYAPVFWAEGGGAAVTGWPQGTPAYMRAPVDMNAGNVAALGILAALYARDRTGRGACVDCSAIETVSASIGDELLAASLGMPAGGLRGNDRPPFVPNDLLPCRGDDRWVAVSVNSEIEWRTLCKVLGASDLHDDPGLRSRLGRWRRRAEIQTRLAALSRERDAGELGAALQIAGLAATRSNTMAEMLADRELMDRGFWHTVTHPMIGPQRIGVLPGRMEPPVLPPERGGPLMGEQSDLVLREWLGMDPAEIATLRHKGVIEEAPGARPTDQ